MRSHRTLVPVDTVSTTVANIPPLCSRLRSAESIPEGANCWVHVCKNQPVTLQVSVLCVHVMCWVGGCEAMSLL